MTSYKEETVQKNYNQTILNMIYQLEELTHLNKILSCQSLTVSLVMEH